MASFNRTVRQMTEMFP